MFDLYRVVYKQSLFSRKRPACLCARARAGLHEGGLAAAEFGEIKLVVRGVHIPQEGLVGVGEVVAVVLKREYFHFKFVTLDRVFVKHNSH